MPTIKCNQCTHAIEVDLPLSPNARYVCSGHTAKIEPEDDELVERCEICEARGCSKAFHSKTEIELKAFCRETIFTSKLNDGMTSHIPNQKDPNNGR